MAFNIKRLTDVAGQDFNSPTCRVRSPHITARESIEIADYIVAQQKRIAELEKEQASGWIRDSNTHVNKTKEQGE